MADNLTPVLIGVCTAQRPKMLKACLDSLAAQIVPEHVSLRAVVVDNEAEPNNRAAVEAQAERFPFPLAYEHEPRRGIPFARNRVLDHALAIEAEWIAFIDDDEIAEPDWLSQLVSATERYGCDVVQGQVYQFADGEEPSRENGKRRSRDGTVLQKAQNDNCILSARLIKEHGRKLRFDENIGLSGGSDSDFYGRAHRLGAYIVYSSEPAVYERLMSDRVGVGASMKRSFFNHVGTYAKNAPSGGNPKAMLYAGRQIIRAFASVLTGTLHVIEGAVLFPLSGGYARRRLKKGAKEIIRLPAVIAAMSGIRFERYRHISGE